MKTIQLTRGFSAVIDDEDYEIVSRFLWVPQVSKCKTRVYAFTNIVKNGKHAQINMQNLILGKRDGLIIDHKNGDCLDNRRSNLRYITKSENAINARKKINNKSGYSGVLYIDRIKKYEAAIKVNYKNIRLGYYDTFDEAKRVRIEAEEKYFPNINLVRERRVEPAISLDRKPNRKWRNASSKYKGVSIIRHKHGNKEYIYWAANIFINGAQTRIKSCKTEKEAAAAYVEMFEKIYGHRPYEL